MDSQTPTSPCAENDTDGDSDKKAKDATSNDTLRGPSVKEEKEGWAESRLNGLDTPATTGTNKAAGEASQQGNSDSAELDLPDDDEVGFWDEDEKVWAEWERVDGVAWLEWRRCKGVISVLFVVIRV